MIDYWCLTLCRQYLGHVAAARGKFFKSHQHGDGQHIFSKFCYPPSSLEKGVVIHINKLELPSSKYALCQVRFKLVQWLWRSLQTDRQTDNGQQVIRKAPLTKMGLKLIKGKKQMKFARGLCVRLTDLASKVELLPAVRCFPRQVVGHVTVHTDVACFGLLSGHALQGVSGLVVEIVVFNRCIVGPNHLLKICGIVENS